MSVLSAAVVGIVSILLYYLCYQTKLNCQGKPKEAIPKKLQWIRTITGNVYSSILYCWFYLNPIQTGLFWSICDWGGAPRTPPLYLWNQ